nr:chorion class A protein Ld2/Ld41 [Helicoverpa armigera]
MSTFAVLLLCIQACLVQNVFSYCSTPAGVISSVAPITAACGATLAPGAAYTPSPYSPSSISYGSSAAFSPGVSAYGGTGEGNVAVVGELPILGESVIAGQVPIMGAVSFGGAVPAYGGVSITGNCACGCGSAY